MKALASIVLLLAAQLPFAATPAHETIGVWTHTCNGIAGRGSLSACLTNLGSHSLRRWPAIDEYADIYFRVHKPELDHFVSGYVSCDHNRVSWNAVRWGQATPPTDAAALAAREALEERFCDLYSDPAAPDECDPEARMFEELPEGRLHTLWFQIAPTQQAADRDRPYSPPYFGSSCRYEYPDSQFDGDLCIGSVSVTATFGDEAAQSVPFRTSSRIAPDGRAGTSESVWLRLGIRKTPTRDDIGGWLGALTHRNQSDWRAANRAAVRRFVRSLYRHERVALSFADDYGRPWEWEVSMRGPAKGKPPHWETAMRRQAAYCLTNEPAQR